MGLGVALAPDRLLLGNLCLSQTVGPPEGLLPDLGWGWCQRGVPRRTPMTGTIQHPPHSPGLARGPHSTLPEPVYQTQTLPRCPVWGPSVGVRCGVRARY